MQVKLYDSDKKYQWNDFVKTSKNGLFMFDRNYMDYHSDRFSDHSLMVYDDKGGLIAILPANARDNVLYSHQGLTFGGFITGRKMRLSDMPSVFNALHAYCTAEGFKKLVYKAVPYFYHRQPAQEDLYALSLHNARVLKVEPSSTIDLQYPRFNYSSGRKEGFKIAAKSNLTVQKTDDYEAFFDMLANLLDEKYQAKPTHSVAEMRLLTNRFPKNIALYGSFEGNAMQAGTIVFIYPDVAHLQYIGTSPIGRETGALDLLIKYLIEVEFKDKRYFDFGISTEQGGQVLNHGLASQKEGFGARTTVHQTFELSF